MAIQVLFIISAFNRALRTSEQPWQSRDPRTAGREKQLQQQSLSLLLGLATASDAHVLCGKGEGAAVFHRGWLSHTYQGFLLWNLTFCYDAFNSSCASTQSLVWLHFLKPWPVTCRKMDPGLGTDWGHRLRAPDPPVLHKQLWRPGGTNSVVTMTASSMTDPCSSPLLLWTICETLGESERTSKGSRLLT